MMSPSHYTELSSATQRVTLPSIHQLFPEHMMRPSLPEACGATHLVQRVKYPNNLSTAQQYQSSEQRQSLSKDPSGGESHHQAMRTAYDDIRSRRTCSPPTRNRSSSSALHSKESCSSPSRQVDYKFHNYSAPGAPPIVLSRHEETLQKTSSPVTCSFDVLRSDPSNTSLEHLVSSKTMPNRGSVTTGHTSAAGIAKGTDPAFKVQLPPSSVPPSPSSPEGSHTPIPTTNQHLVRMINPSHRSDTPRGLSSATRAPPFATMMMFPVYNTPLLSNVDAKQREQSEEFTDDTGTGSDDDNVSGGDNSKKHVCSHCLKRFNRPSSLRIHVNTHTGATPFRCPWPDCGREFNVNSNMRRHYRNHTAPGFSRSFSKDNRRRRKRGPTGVVFINHGAMSLSKPRDPEPLLTSPAVSTATISESSGDDSNIGSPKGMDGNQFDDEEDELMDTDSMDEGEAQRSYPTSARIYDVGSLSGHPRSHSHSFDGRSTSSSLSPSHSSASPHELHSPSGPYPRSRGSHHVSTALRPAFQGSTQGGSLD